MKRRKTFARKGQSVYMQADEDFGNALIGYGAALRVPTGKWILSYRTSDEVRDREVKLEFSNKGRLVQTYATNQSDQVRGRIVQDRQVLLNLNHHELEFCISEDFTSMELIKSPEQAADDKD